MLYLKYGFGTKSVCSEIIKVSETYVYCILVSTVTLTVRFCKLEGRRVRVTAGFISRVFMFYTWRIVYSIFVLLTTLFIPNDVLQDLIGFVICLTRTYVWLYLYFVFCIFYRIGNMVCVIFLIYVVPQHVWVDVWNNNNITTFYNICDSFSCRTFET